MKFTIETVSRKKFSPEKPYDFKIGPESGALKEFCDACQTVLSEEEKWMEKALLNAMRISLFLHGRVRLIACGRCEKAHCAAKIRKWLIVQGPLQVETIVLNLVDISHKKEMNSINSSV